MKRVWQRIHKFISEPKYEYVCRNTEELERVGNDVPMVELRGDVDDDDDDDGGGGESIDAPLIAFKNK